MLLKVLAFSCTVAMALLAATTMPVSVLRFVVLSVVLGYRNVCVVAGNRRLHQNLV